MSSLAVLYLCWLIWAVVEIRVAEKPELVERPEVAAKVAVWFWQQRVSNKALSYDNVKDVTKGINPGLKHLDQRSDKLKSFQVAMK